MGVHGLGPGIQASCKQEDISLAAQINRTEAHLGQLAQNKGTAEDVKEYGRRLQSDHKAAYDKLTATATGFTVPKVIGAEHRKIVNWFEKLTENSSTHGFDSTTELSPV